MVILGEAKLMLVELVYIEFAIRCMLCHLSISPTMLMFSSAQPNYSECLYMLGAQGSVK